LFRSICEASCLASVSSSVSNNCTANDAFSKRPTALIRGPSTKPIVCSSISSSLILHTSFNTCKPRCSVFFNCSIPNVANTRFSSTSGTKRSEERRVGKECRNRWWRYQNKKKRKKEQKSTVEE